MVPGRQGSHLAQTLIGHWGRQRPLMCARPKSWTNRWNNRPPIWWNRPYRRFQPEIVLFGATELGRSLAPRVAARLHTGLTADCTVLDPESKNLQKTRPAFGGNIMATIVCPEHRPQMATVRPGVMKKLPREEGRGPARQGEVEALPAPALHISAAILAVANQTAAAQRGHMPGRKDPGHRGGGQGHRAAPKNFQSAAGAGRPCWAGTVELQPRGLWWTRAGPSRPCRWGRPARPWRPKLYIACGISGAIQHLAGMAGFRR